MSVPEMAGLTTGLLAAMAPAIWLQSVCIPDRGGSDAQVIVQWSGAPGRVELVRSRADGEETTVGRGGASGMVTLDAPPVWQRDVFRLVSAGVRSRELAWSSVTRLPRNGRFGTHYIFADDADIYLANSYEDAVYERLLPHTRRNLAAMSAAGVDVIRVMVWTFCGTHLEHGEWRFGEGYQQMLRNLPRFLSDCAAVGIRVDVAFANELYTYGHYKQMDWPAFVDRSVEWINGVVQAIEADPIARSAVFCYDYQNEVHQMHAGVFDYVNALYDRTLVPRGKRAISLSSKENIALLAQHRGSRRFDFVDIHFYPDNQAGSDWDIIAWLDDTKRHFPEARLFVGEIGFRNDKPEHRISHARVIERLYIQSVEAGADWVMPWSYIEQFCRGERQDARGAMANLISLAPNGDFDVEDAGRPWQWSATDDSRLSVMTSDAAHPLSGRSFARLTPSVNANKGSLRSARFRVRGGDTLFANALLRTDSRYVVVAVEIYNEAGQSLGICRGPRMPQRDGWVDYLRSTAPFAVALPESAYTASIQITPEGDGWTHCDADCVAVWTRPAPGADWMNTTAPDRTAVSR